MTPPNPNDSGATRVLSSPPQQQPIYAPAPPPNPFPPARKRGHFKSLLSTLRFLSETEVHVYSFAVSVNILISFYPFLVAMILICIHLLHWQEAANVIIQTVADSFPGDFGMKIDVYLRASSHQTFSWLSIFLLFFTANGIFTPLEVAFNRIWNAKGNRNFLRNQLVSLGLICLAGTLALATASLDTVFVGNIGSSGFAGLARGFVIHALALPATAIMIFLLYWLLPNTSIPVSRLLPSSIAVTILIQIAEFLNLLLWPWLRDKLRADVPPFVQSISIVFWSFILTLIVLAGAEWAARGESGATRYLDPADRPQS